MVRRGGGDRAAASGSLTVVCVRCPPAFGLKSGRFGSAAGRGETAHGPLCLLGCPGAFPGPARLGSWGLPRQRRTCDGGAGGGGGEGEAGRGGGRQRRRGRSRAEGRPASPAAWAARAGAAEARPSLPRRPEVCAGKPAGGGGFRARPRAASPCYKHLACTISHRRVYL